MFGHIIDKYLKETFMARKEKNYFRQVLIVSFWLVWPGTCCEPGFLNLGVVLWPLPLYCWACKYKLPH